MLDILIVANWLLPLAYLAVLIDYGARFFLRTGDRGRSVLLPATLALHVLFLVALGLHLGRAVPANNYEMLSALAAGTAMVYWLVELAGKDRRTGAFVLLAAFLLEYTAAVFLPRLDFTGTGPIQAWHSPRLHTVPAMVAYIAFTISAIHGLLHLLARRDLKRHRIGLLFDRLPPLETLGTMTWHAMLLGFGFMTAAILTGAVMFAAHPVGDGGMGAKTLSKILAGTAAWLIYGGAILGKAFGRWTADRVSRVAVVGFLVVVAMLVTGIVLS